MDPSDACTHPSQQLKVQKELFFKTHGGYIISIDSTPLRVEVDMKRWHSAPPPITKIKVHIEPEPKRDHAIKSLRTPNIRVNSFTMKMEILLEPTSNKLCNITGSTSYRVVCLSRSDNREHAEYDESNTYVLERFNTSAGNPVKKILLKLNLSDHRLFKMVVECQSVKVKEFQERCNIKAFQEWYEHVGPEVASPQDGKVTRWRRDCAWLMISRCSRSQCQIQVQGTSSIQEVNDHYNIFTRDSQEYELKTKDKA
ncbi:hypothetical protein Tco_0153129 [Tanacetum coccineum]